MDTEIPATVRASLSPLACDVAFTHARVISQRRGATVWCVTTDVGHLAVKVGEEGHGARVVAREAEVLLQLGEHAHGLYCSHGYTWDGRSWLATRWRTGWTTWQRWHAAREADSKAGRRTALAAAAELADALAELHTLGWCHGDVQPRHAFHDGGVARLIDYSYAQGPVPPSPHVPHRGGLFPLLAPEMAAILLDAGDDQAGVTLTPAAEVYSLAGTLYGCWTQTYPVDYDDRQPRDLHRQEKLAHITSGKRRDLSLDRPYPWPDLEQLLTAALDSTPENRPTAAEIADEARGLAR